MTSITKNKSILILGASLYEKDNNLAQIIRELNKSSEWEITQKWGLICNEFNSNTIEYNSLFEQAALAPKFIIINRLLSQFDLEQYDFVVICDDDIVIFPDFIDTYLTYINRYNFSLAQPALTRDSYIGLFFVGQMPGILARRTRFVEIGPLFSIRKDLYDVLLPFDESSPMGWGYDLTWPLMVEQKNLRMGIIDATPVAHTLRKPVSNYDPTEARSAMDRFLSKYPHLSFEEAFTIIDSYA